MGAKFHLLVLNRKAQPFCGNKNESVERERNKECQALSWSLTRSTCPKLESVHFLHPTTITINIQLQMSSKLTRLTRNLSLEAAFALVPCVKTTCSNPFFSCNRFLQASLDNYKDFSVWPPVLVIRNPHCCLLCWRNLLRNWTISDMSKFLDMLKAMRSSVHYKSEVNRLPVD